MRLGQLARKLNVKQTDISSFLEKESGITIEITPNLKLEDDLVDLITQHYTPKIEEKEEDVKIVPVAEKPAKEESPIENKVEPEPVIDVPQPKVTGPKIIGKIDLPEDSKEEVEVDGVVYEKGELEKRKKEEKLALQVKIAAEKEEKKKEEFAKKKKEMELKRAEEERQALLENTQNKILSAEEEKKRVLKEKKELDRQKRLEEERKKKQKLHYANKHAVKTVVPKKKVKKEAPITKKTSLPEAELSVPPTVAIDVSAPEKAVETGWFKKFLKWLNT